MIKLLIVCVCLLNLAFIYKKRQFVSSSSIWLFVYLLIMVFYPINSINRIFENEGIIDLCALIGAICFFVGNIIGTKYKIQWGKKYGYRTSQRAERYLVPNYTVSRIAFWISFVISIVALVYFMGTEGVFSILRGSSTAKHFALHGDKSNSFYVFAVHMMVPCILAMWITARSTKEKRFRIFALFIYIAETVLFGFTRIFLITIIAIILIYEIRKIAQRKQVLFACFGVLGAMAILISLNFIRSLGLGKINNLANYINMSYFFESTDFGASYVWFDRLLEIEPPYINPIVYLKPIFMMIPRVLWPNKPEPLSLQVLKMIDPAKAATGYSTAGNSVLGEGYAILGYSGLAIYPMIWGLVCASLDRNYYNRLRAGKEHSLNNIIYYIFAVFVVISGQRGDWSQYMGIVCWFYIVPLYIMSRVTIRLNHTKRNGR